MQTVLSGPAETAGSGCTVTVELAVAVHPVFTSVPVTVYTVVTVGDTEILVPLAPFDQENPPAPDAVKTAVSPAQMVAALAVTLGGGVTFTCTDAVPVQPGPLLTVAVYCVDTCGAAFTGLPEVLLRPVGGVQITLE